MRKLIPAWLTVNFLIKKRVVNTSLIIIPGTASILGINNIEEIPKNVIYSKSVVK